MGSILAQITLPQAPWTHFARPRGLIYRILGKYLSIFWGDIYRLLRHLGIVCAVCPNLKHSRGAKLDWKRADVLSKNNCCAKVKVGQALFLP